MSTPTAAVGARRVTADVAVQIVAQVANLALGIVVTAVIARRLGATGYGEWSTIFALVSIVGYFADLKLQDVTIREIVGEPEREGEWLGALLSLRLALGVPVTLVAVILLAITARDSAMRIASIIISLTLITSGLSAAVVVLRMRVRNDLNMLVVSFNSVAWGVAAIVIAGVGGGLVPLAVAFTASTIASGALMLMLASRRARIRFRGAASRWMALVRVGASLGLAGLLTLANASLDQVLVYRLAPHRVDAGLYGGAYRILSSAGFVPVAVMTTLFPLMAGALKDDPDRARRMLQNALDYLAMVSLPVLAFSLVDSRGLLALLLGPQFVAAAGILPVLMAAFVAICWGYVAASLVLVLGLQKRFVVYAFTGLVVNVGLNVALVPTYGYVAAAWVTLVTEVTVLALSLRTVLTAIGLRPRVGRVLRVTAVSAALGCVLFGLHRLGAGLGWLVAATAVLYPSLLLASRALGRDDLSLLLAGRETAK